MSISERDQALAAFFNWLFAHVAGIKEKQVGGDHDRIPSPAQHEQPIEITAAVRPNTYGLSIQPSISQEKTEDGGP